MRFSAIALIALAAAPATIDAACIWPWNGGTLQVCKQPGKKDCLGAQSDNVCVNLIGGPFVSGFSSGSYSCTIYSERGCGGSTSPVDRAGWSRFNFTPKSFRCPCV